MSAGTCYFILKLLRPILKRLIISRFVRSSTYLNLFSSVTLSALLLVGLEKSWFPRVSAGLIIRAYSKFANPPPLLSPPPKVFFLHSPESARWADSVKNIFCFYSATLKSSENKALNRIQGNELNKEEKVINFLC